MTAEVRLMMQLLGSELFGAEVTVNITESDWYKLVALGEEHSVLSLLYPGTKKLSGVPPIINTKLRSAAMLAAVNVEKMMGIQSEILARMETEKIPCAILKGSSVAVYYPHPELRLLGDIDLLVAPLNEDHAAKILTDLGFSCYDKHSVHHSCYRRHGVIVELHQAVSRFSNAKKAKFCSAYLQEATMNVLQDHCAGHTFPVLSFSYQIIALLKHMDSHLRGNELRIRQLCDWSTLVYNNENKIDSSLLMLMEKCGLLTYAKVLTQVCVLYFGLPKQRWCGDITDKLANDMLEEILHSGLHNEVDSAKNARMLLTAEDRSDSILLSMVKSYIKQCNYIAKRDHPYITKICAGLPVFWIFYPIRYFSSVLLGKRKHIEYQILLSDVSKRRKLLEELKLYK